MNKTKSVIKVGTIQQRILLIRGEKVIIDADLDEFKASTEDQTHWLHNRLTGPLMGDPFILSTKAKERTNL